MSYTVFARKYRPQTFDEIVGQDHIVRTLKNAIEQNRLAQAYLFVGPRGTGKTSTARIFAKALNCVNAPTTNPCGVCDMCKEIASGSSLNVLEFDAASNTQVDKIREIIIETVKYVPIRGRYKIYIVDEVHMLSPSSFNALLKTLEEPPAHVKFVFATTDVQKVPTTIISRCQRFDLRRISVPEIAKHLLFIAGKEKIALSAAAADAIARGAEGGLRDAESMLDQLVAFCGDTIEEEDVLSIFGFTAQQTVAELCETLLAGQSSKALAVIHEQAEAGKDLSRLMSDLITHLRNLLVMQCDPEGVKGELSAEAITQLAEQSGRIEPGKLLDLIDQFAGAENRMKFAANRKMHFEVAAIRAIQTLGQATLSEVLDSLDALRGGAPVVATKSAPASKTESREPRLEIPKTVPAPVSAPTAPPMAIPKMDKPAPAQPPVPKNLPPRLPIGPPRISETPEPAAVAVPAVPVDPFKLWPALVARFREARPMFASYVEAGTLLNIEGDVALVGFPPDQFLALEYCEKASNRKLLEQIASELAGRPITVKCVKREGLVVTPVAPTPKPEAPPADPMRSFKDDPLIKRALEEFKAQILPA